MKFSSIVPYYVLILSNYALAVPIPVTLNFGPTAPEKHREKVAYLQEATIEANTQLNNAWEVLKTPDDPKHKHLLNIAFGEGHEKHLQTIKNNVETMRYGKLRVTDVNANLGPNTRATADSNSEIKFSKNLDPNTEPIAKTAGTIIHEIAHALPPMPDDKARDYFSKNADPQKVKPITKGESKTVDRYSGYLHKDFVQLRKEAPHVLAYNADSYKLLAHVATNGPNAPINDGKNSWMLKAEDKALTTSTSHAPDHVSHPAQVGPGNPQAPHEPIHPASHLETHTTPHTGPQAPHDAVRVADHVGTHATTHEDTQPPPGSLQPPHSVNPPTAPGTVHTPVKFSFKMAARLAKPPAQLASPARVVAQDTTLATHGNAPVPHSQAHGTSQVATNPHEAAHAPGHGGAQPLHPAVHANPQVPHDAAHTPPHVAAQVAPHLPPQAGPETQHKDKKPRTR